MFPNKAGTPWSANDDKLLTNLVSQGDPTSLIASRLERTENAIISRIQVIGEKGVDVTPNDYKEADIYMVYAEGGRSPGCKHATEELASREAERLAIQTGKSVYVLKAIRVCTIVQVSWVEL